MYKYIFDHQFTLDIIKKRRFSATEKHYRFYSYRKTWSHYTNVNMTCCVIQNNSFTQCSLTCSFRTTFSHWQNSTRLYAYFSCWKYKTCYFFVVNVELSISINSPLSSIWKAIYIEHLDKSQRIISKIIGPDLNAQLLTFSHRC